MIDINYFPSINTAENYIHTKIFDFYNTMSYLNLNKECKEALDELINIFDKKIMKISFMECENHMKIKSILKAFSIYAIVKNYQVGYVFKTLDRRIIKDINTEISQYYPCNIKACSIDKFTNGFLGTGENSILIFDNVDMDVIKKYINTSIFGVSKFIVVANIAK